VCSPVHEFCTSCANGRPKVRHCGRGTAAMAEGRRSGTAALAEHCGANLKKECLLI